MPNEEGNCRFCYLAGLLAKSGDHVELITSDYYHARKTYRRTDINSCYHLPYKVTFLHEKKYKNNISAARILGHYLLGIHLRKYLRDHNPPDLIYCAVPSLDVAYESISYARLHGIKVVLDVQDLWPEAFRIKFNPVLAGKLIYRPFYKKADYVYTYADKIIAVSKTYIMRAKSCNRKDDTPLCVYIGTQLEKFDSVVAAERRYPDTITFVYIGTLGYNYDLPCIFKALKIVHGKSSRPIRFLIMGDGPKRKVFEKLAKGCGVEVQFTGRLKYEEMVSALKSCDIAVNPIIKGAVGSIINKVADYAAAGLPVINTQECREYRDLIKLYDAGYNCKCADEEDVAKKMLLLITDESKRKRKGSNNRSLAENLFDRDKAYPKIVQKLHEGQ
jgi:Glycosyltransferase